MIQKMQPEKSKASVFIAIFTGKERDGWLCPAMAEFLVSLTTQKPRAISLEVLTLKPIDYARNCAVKDFLATDFQWLLMIDNDMAPPPNLLDMVDRAEERMDILVPKCPGIMDSVVMSTPGIGILLGWQLFAGGLGKNEWCEIAWSGTGVIFIRRRVFECMGNQGWFRFIYDADGMMLNSEDINFCQKARKAGFTIWGNQQFAVEHFKTVPLFALVRGVKVVTPNLPPGELGLELLAPNALRQSEVSLAPQSPSAK